MDYKELLEKYQALLVENNHLKKEIKRLKGQQGISERQGIPFDFSAEDDEDNIEEEPPMPPDKAEWQTLVATFRNMLTNDL
jgi:hypothetical protein